MFFFLFVKVAGLSFVIKKKNHVHFIKEYGTMWPELLLSFQCLDIGSFHI